MNSLSLPLPPPQFCPFVDARREDPSFGSGWVLSSVPVVPVSVSSSLWWPSLVKLVNDAASWFGSVRDAVKI